MKVLTIAVPCYERPDEFIACVRSIQRAIDHSSSGRLVELVIWANDWGTERLATKELGIKEWVFSQPFNVGMTANIASCIVNCRTKWLWIVGSDDTVKENAVDTIFQHIESYRNVGHFVFSSRRDEVRQIEGEDFMHVGGITDTVMMAEPWQAGIRYVYDAASTEWPIAIGALNIVYTAMFSTATLAETRGVDGKHYNPNAFALALDMIPPRYREGASKALLPVCLHELRRQELPFLEHLRRTVSLSLRFPIGAHRKAARNHVANWVKK